MFKPKIACFHCAGNVLDCKCVYPETSWVVEARTRWATPVKPKIVKEISTPTPITTILQRRDAMRFVFETRLFAIEFRRDYRKIERVDENGKLHKVQTKFPYTTCNILELDPTSRNEKGFITHKNSKVFQTATVGAWHKEPNFTLETGRLRALRNVTRTLPKEMRPLVWDAYFGRTPKPLSPSVQVVGPVPPQGSGPTQVVEAQIVS